MENNVKLTDKGKAVLTVLAGLPEGGFAEDVRVKMDGATFNAVNATLAYLAGKGFATKVKAVKDLGNGVLKLLTRYEITDQGRLAVPADPAE